MLKIKDNVDLKELEKFGYEENYPYNYLKFIIDTKMKIDVLHIDLKTRKIDRTIKEYLTPEIVCKTVKQQYIADLIKADLVEKVEE